MKGGLECLRMAGIAGVIFLPEQSAGREPKPKKEGWEAIAKIRGSV